MSNKELTTPPRHIADFINKIQLVPVKDIPNLTPAKRFNAAGQGGKLALAGKLYQGYALYGLKEELGHGNYLAGLAKETIAPRTASKSISLYSLACRTPANVWPALAVIEASKLELMCSWTDDELGQFFEGAMVRGITIEDAQTEPLRELQSRIKESRPESELEKKLNTLDKRLETATIENTELKKQLSNKQRNSTYPEFVETIRHESTALMDKASLCFDDMEKMYQQLEDLGRLKGNDTEHARNWNIAATSLYHNLRGVIARSEKFLKELDDTLPEEVTGPVSPAYYLEPNEITAAVNERELLIEQHTHEAVIRKNQRDMQKPRGRGRPAKGGGK
ncbi:MAG TPA: hypothetical protein VIQ81_04055 [Gammaproteobacteria bacterium]